MALVRVKDKSGAVTYLGERYLEKYGKEAGFVPAPKSEEPAAPAGEAAPAAEAPAEPEQETRRGRGGF
jgi:hypothetical protein